jgi:hypothetical protein
MTMPSIKVEVTQADADKANAMGAGWPGAILFAVVRFLDAAGVPQAVPEERRMVSVGRDTLTVVIPAGYRGALDPEASGDGRAWEYTWNLADMMPLGPGFVGYDTTAEPGEVSATGNPEGRPADMAEVLALAEEIEEECWRDEAEEGEEADHR